MSDHKIDAEFIGKLTEARIAARKEVETNDYYGHAPEARMANFSAGIENGLGGDVGKYLGMLDPETVFLIVDELVVRRRRMRNIRTMADYDLGGEDLAPVVLPTEYVESFTDPESALAKFLKCDSAVVIPKPDVKFQVGDQWVGIEDFTEVRNVLGGWLESSLGFEDQVDHLRLTLGGLAREVTERFDAREVNLQSCAAGLRGQRNVEKERADALQVEIENYTEANQSLTKAIEKWVESNAALTQQRDAILGRIIDWENAYRDGKTFGGGDLVSRVSDLINGYGQLYQQLARSTDVLKAQNDELDAFRDSDASTEAGELLREVDVLGAYLKYPVRETETETRLEIVKAALTKIEEQDELIGTLQRALVAAQSGQPRRPTGMREESEKVTGSEGQPLATWFEKVFKDLHDVADPERLPKLGGPLDEMLRHLFDKK